MDWWIDCFGTFVLSREGTGVPIKGRKAQILLGLLAVARHRTISRSRLSALLWERSGVDGARTSLRQTLMQLRRSTDDDLIQAQGDALTLRPGVASDASAFSEALACGDDAQAARLYCGQFLEGALPNGPDLEAAVGAERARLAGLAAQVFAREMTRLGEGPEPEAMAHRLLSLDPLDEAAHRHLMVADASRGGRGAARLRYEALRASLRRDLDVEPGAETTALYERLRRSPFPRSDEVSAPSSERAVEPALLLVAVAVEGVADWTVVRTAAAETGGRLLDDTPAEIAICWPDGALRIAADTALDLAAATGDALSFGLAAGGETPTPKDLARVRRLAAQAEPGMVLVAPGLAARLGRMTADDAPVQLRASAVPPRQAIPFVGRAVELAQTAAAIDAARASGTGLAVHLCGEAGIGKSRLAEEIVRREFARGAHAVKVGFVPFGGDGRHVGQQLMAGLPVSSDEVVPDATTSALLAWLRGTAISVEQELRLSAMSDAVRRVRMIDLVAKALVRAAQTDGVIVVMEDGHWAPPGIGDVLLDLLDRVSQASVVVVLTERPHGGDLGRRLAARARIGLVRIALGPLGAADAEKLSRLGASERADAAAVLEQAAGHPLFLLRLLEAGWTSGNLPRSVTDLVAEQVEGLPQEDRTALRCAAILGMVFDPAEARAVFPEMPVPRPVGDVLIPTDTGLAFGHDLVRQAIYDGIPAETRSTWHGRAAAHHRGGDPVRWARHALLAGDDADACRATGAAANAMISDLRLGAAAEFIESGLARGGDPEAIAELYSCRAGIRRTRSDLHGALEDYRAAYAIAQAAPTQVAMLVRQALALHRLGRGPEADQALDAAEMLADRIGLAGLGRAEIHEQRGNRAFAAGDATVCLAQHARGLAAVEASGDPRGLARAHGGLGDAHVLSGQMRTAYEHFERAVDLAAKSGLGLVYQEYAFMRSYSLLFAEPGPKAHILADLAVEAAREAGADRAEMLARNVRTELRLVALDLDGARADIDRMEDLIASDPEQRFVADIALLRGWLALREGDAQSAFAVLEPHVSRAQESAYNGAAILSVAALAAADAALQKALFEMAADRVARGAMVPAAIGYHCFALEAAARSNDVSSAQLQIAQLKKIGRREPLGLIERLLHVASTRFGKPSSSRAMTDLQNDLHFARLDGIAIILDGGFVAQKA